MTETYYVHLMPEDRRVGPRAKYWGTPRYGYRTLRQAIRHLPEGAWVVSRYCSGSDDWSGELVYARDTWTERALLAKTGASAKATEA